MNKSVSINSTKTNSKGFEWTPRRMIFWGFNIIAGYTFVVGLSNVFTGVGNWLPVLFLISGLIAFGSGLSFGRLAKRFNKNGGTMLYVRNVMGRKASGFAGFYQLLQMPLLTASIPITTVWLFAQLKIGGNNLSEAQNFIHIWYIYLGGFLILLVACMIPALGFTSSEITLYIMWIFKWAFVIIIFALAFVEIKNFPTNIGQNGYNPLKNSSSFSVFSRLITSIITFFFAFGGFEAVAAQSEDIKDSDTKIISILLTMIVAVCIFYLFFYFFFLGALGAKPGGTNTATLVAPTNGDANPVNSLLAVVFSGGQLNRVLLGAAGIGIFVVTVFTQVLNKCSSRIQCGWGNAKIISAYSAIGFLPSAIGKKNKYNKRSNALGLDITICIAFSLVFLGLSFAGKYLIFGVLDVISYISFMQYLLVSICVVILHLKKSDKFRVSKFELIYFAIIAVVIFFLLGSYTGLGIYKLVQYVSGKDSGGLAGLTIIIDVIMLVIIFIGAIGIIFLAKFFKWDKNAEKLDKNTISDEIDTAFGHAKDSYDDFAFKGF